MATLKITLDINTKLWFTSDTHYNHSNICSATSNWDTKLGTHRQFDSLEQMNQAIVDNINEVVGENDILIHLGDWSFGGFDSIELFRKQLKCKNIHLVLGNHDHHIERNKNGIRSLFTTVNDYLQLEVRNPQLTKHEKVIKYNFMCMHYPISSWNGLGIGTMHLHGHTHLSADLRVSDGRAMDVGFDGNQLYPISMERVLELLKHRPKVGLVLKKDHHIL